MCNVNLDKVASVLASMPGVLAAWVFGSAQEGHIHAGGDLDVGVLFVAPPTLDELADLRADLQRAVQFDNIDLVVLNAASPILRFEAVSGRLLFCRDAARRAAFVSLTAREYEESMAMVQRALAERAMAKRGAV
ncbi:MAG TPA: nucleotidyltransferase domain-containing protein [Candidatus Tectomicrobia bacterium]|jgi:predicted nucleotidyltransferase